MPIAGWLDGNADEKVNDATANAGVNAEQGRHLSGYARKRERTRDSGRRTALAALRTLATICATVRGNLNMKWSPRW